MSLRSSHTRPPWGTLFFALLGLLWCGYIAFPSGDASSCVTSGCTISRNFTIGGMSLWWIGGAYFFILMVVCLRGMRHFAWRLAQLALSIDALLLLIMFFTGPCFDCLVVAVFFFLTAFCLRPSGNGGWFRGEQASPFIVFPIWLGLFLGNSVVGVNESMPHWTMGNPEYDNVRVYFAPSCSACREALKSLGDSAVLYPVLEQEGDLDSILRLESMLTAGVSVAKAIDQSINGENPVPSQGFMRSLYLRMQLMRNKAFVLKHHFRVMPLIEINGMPRSWISHDSPVSERAPEMSYFVPQGNISPAEGQTSPDQNSLPAGQSPQGEGSENKDAGNNLFQQSDGESLWSPDGFAQCGGEVPCPD